MNPASIKTLIAVLFLQICIIGTVQATEVSGATNTATYNNTILVDSGSENNAMEDDPNRDDATNTAQQPTQYGSLGSEFPIAEDFDRVFTAADETAARGSVFVSANDLKHGNPKLEFSQTLNQVCLADDSYSGVEVVYFTVPNFRAGSVVDFIKVFAHPTVIGTSGSGDRVSSILSTMYFYFLDGSLGSTAYWTSQETFLGDYKTSVNFEYFPGFDITRGHSNTIMAIMTNGDCLQGIEYYLK